MEERFLAFKMPGNVSAMTHKYVVLPEIIFMSGVDLESWVEDFNARGRWYLGLQPCLMFRRLASPPNEYLLQGTYYIKTRPQLVSL